MTATSPAAPDVLGTPPVAKKRATRRMVHGEELVDEYGWLRDKDDPETIAYLEAENAYADAAMAPAAGLQARLYDEMLGRIRQTDSSVPYRRRGYFYYSRTVEGLQYPIYARRKGSVDAEEEILLDLNELAAGKEFMAIGALEVSDDSSLLAFSTDDTGYRQYKLQVKDLRTGAVEWATDNRTLLYSVENGAKRHDRVFRHRLGTSEHVLVYEETDPLYDVWVERSRSGKWLYIVSDSKTTSEVRLVDAARPDGDPVLMLPRREDHKYYPEHRGDRFYILTNDAGINYRIATAPVSDFARADAPRQAWTELVPHRPPVRIETIELFANHLVASVRENGLDHLEVYDLRVPDGEPPRSHRISFPEAAYSIYGSTNAEFETTVYRYTYESLITPASVYDYDLDSREQTLLKRTEVLGGYDPSQYAVERIFATADDGARIPIAMVYRRDVDPRGRNPLLLYAYGSYGAPMPDGFNSNRLSLLDRGVVYAIAHIRGGGEMGKEWHEQGRMMAKKNTFTDFIAAAEHLIRESYTTSERLAIQGGSAGGLLVGAVLNMRPELFGAAIAQVPFVDVMNTMLDPTLPLTTQEYVEWGNPNEPEAFAYMKSYCPYTNVRRCEYPPLLVRAALNDSQVGYWEAAKWVAKLRANKTDDNIVLLRVNMDAGHGGASGRYDKLHEVAHDYAWLLMEFGITA